MYGPVLPAFYITFKEELKRYRETAIVYFGPCLPLFATMKIAINISEGYW